MQWIRDALDDMWLLCTLESFRLVLQVELSFPV
jgi:hypothetical protein